MFCQPLPENNSISAGTSNNSIHHKLLDSHTALMYSPGHHHGARPRAVIASKRAAQNRAAQRAFRQRRERYIKDLERKAKLMDEWQQEMEQLRHQNKELVENSLRLEKQIHQQQQQINHLEKNNSHENVSSSESNSCASEVIVPAPVVVYMDPPTIKKQNPAKKQHQEEEQLLFLPINLNAPEKIHFASSPTSTYSSSSSSSFNGYEQQYNSNNGFLWNESYEPDFDLLPSHDKDHDLNNLYADLLATNHSPNFDATSKTQTSSPPYYETSTSLMPEAH